MKIAAVLLAFIAMPGLAVAQTTTQASAPAPLRHLEYSARSHTTATSTSASYDGTSSAMATSGENLTISVDVLEAAKDGGLVVRAQAYDNDNHRQDAPHTCAIYGDGRVIRPPHDDLESETQLLLSLLGRGFYDPSTDGSGWQRQLDTTDGPYVSRFRVVGAADASPVHLNEHSELQDSKSLYNHWISDTDIMYDTAMSVPVTVHDEGHMKRGGGATVYQSTDLKLLKDSFAKPSGA
jgi:hypothetical protein